MRAYGIPRDLDIEYPDVGDIQHFGMKSSVGQFPTKSGEYRSYTRSAESRRSTRRLWKRCARRAGNKEISNELKEFG